MGIDIRPGRDIVLTGLDLVMSHTNYDSVVPFLQWITYTVIS